MLKQQYTGYNRFWGVKFLALEGRYMPAHGNALGNNINNWSPEVIPGKVKLKICGVLYSTFNF